MLRMLYARANGDVLDHPVLGMMGRTGSQNVVPQHDEMIPLPYGASLVMLSNRLPLGLGTDGTAKLPDEVEEGNCAVGALLPQGYTRTYLPAALLPGDDFTPLPLFGYAAVGIEGEQIMVAARKTERETYKWDPRFYNTSSLAARVAKLRRQFPENRIVAQLAKCALEYHCFTAQNLFYRRWEAGIPVSPVCNARCLGCISKQPAECCPAPQSRINFIPKAAEISEIGINHLRHAPQAIISFGQGCEGEPSLQAGTIAQAIRKIRRCTPQGIINMNTNAGNPDAMEQLCRAGLNAIRVSLNSACPAHYAAYYRPVNYSFDDVKRSIQIARKHGVFISLNLLAFPGVTDAQTEVDALYALLRETGIQMVQLRNLNIDPDFYLPLVSDVPQPPLGMVEFIKKLKTDFPDLRVGNFSPFFTCHS